jgi:hypothetical protein
VAVFPWPSSSSSLSSASPGCDTSSPRPHRQRDSAPQTLHRPPRPAGHESFPAACIYPTLGIARGPRLESVSKCFAGAPEVACQVPVTVVSLTLAYSQRLQDGLTWALGEGSNAWSWMGRMRRVTESIVNFYSNSTLISPRQIRKAVTGDGAPAARSGTAGYPDREMTQETPPICIPLRIVLHQSRHMRSYSTHRPNQIGNP